MVGDSVITNPTHSATHAVTGRRRLVSGGTERFTKSISTWVFMRVMEPAAFVMTRRMLLGVKARAEAEWRRASRHGGAGQPNRVAAA